ncbi:portal protein [Vibrio phage pVco-7]
MTDNTEHDDMNTSSSKLTEWKNEPSVADLQSNYDEAKGTKDTQVGLIDDWLAQLHVTGKYKPNTPEGKSSVQPQLIRKQAEWRYAALSESFLNDEDLFKVSPKTHADREAARQNGLILNYQFNNQIGKVKLVDDLVRTLVNEGTAIMRVEWIFEEQKVTENVPVYSYMEADEQSTQLIMQGVQMVQQSPTVLETLPDALQESIRYTMENQRPILATIVGYEEQEVVKVVKNQPGVTLCDYHNVLVDPTCDGNVDEAQFIIYSYETSRSELMKSDFYENVDKIPEDSTDTDGNHYNLNDSSFKFEDKARKKLVVYEYWGYWDIDGSGVTTPIVASWVGDVMIRLEKNPFPDGELPFVIIPYLPVKDSVYGEPDAALLSDNQKLIGALTRGQIDVMARSANGQKGMAKDALDSTNLRKYRQGEDYFFNPNKDPRASIIEHTYPELPASSYNLLQMFNMESEALTGVKTFSQGITGDALGSTAAGVNNVVGASGKRELGILRRIADGMTKVAKKILAMNGEWLSDDEVIRITDEEFIQINRDNLAGSFDIKLSISNGETDAIKAQELSFMLQTMGQSLPFDMTKLILSEIAELRGMPDLAKLIKTYQPQPDPLQELEMQKTQLEVQDLQVSIQEKLANIQKTQAEIQETISKSRKLNTESNLNDLDFVEQESGVKQERELELMGAQADSNMKRDIVNNVLNTNKTNQG